MSSCGRFPRRKYSADNRGIQLVLALYDIAGVVPNSEDEDGQGAFFFEAFLSDGYGEDAIQIMLAVGGFVAVLAGVSREDPHLVVVVGQAVVRFGEQT